MFAERLKELRKSQKMRQVEFAAIFNISSGTVGMWETGKRTPDIEMIKSIASYFNVSVDYLLGGEDPYRRFPGAPTSTGGVWIPVLGAVAGGVPIEAVEDVEDWEEIDMDTASRGDHFALRVRGDSMEPRIYDGDVVIVRQQSDVNNNDTAVVLVNGDSATVKRIKKDANGVMLIPNNPAHEPVFYSNRDCAELPVVVLGKVVELRGKL